MIVMCEINSTSANAKSTDVLKVESDIGGAVCLTLNGQSICVYARDLRKAIENCTNS